MLLLVVLFSEETLKYLFLLLDCFNTFPSLLHEAPQSPFLIVCESVRLFSDDATLPLDQFVLGTEAHPVPILHTLRLSATVAVFSGFRV